MEDRSHTERIILRHLQERHTVFVFPTGLAATAWADRMLVHVEAVAMDRFIAWDSFKSEAIRSQQQNKASIPAMMRKIFASHLIQENGRLVNEGRQPLFESLINPRFAREAQSFANWIASLLPSLETWRKNHRKAGLEPDAQDRDLQTLHRRYQQFLEETNRFDPAWEQPPFHDDGHHYVIFYPEVLSDFSEYRHILESSPHITLVTAEEVATDRPIPATECIAYDNARQELRETALFIRNLAASGSCPYSAIFVSVPDMETYAPYLRREFQLYAIPAVFRAGKNLADYGAARLFRQIHDCHTADFSFESLNELLQNQHLPWKEAGLNKELVAFGIKHSCLCSYMDGDKKADPWLAAFKQNPREERLKNLYLRLQKEVKALAKAATFEKLREAYFQFRDSFLDMEKIDSEGDLVLGRCLTELAGLMDLEKEFPRMQLPNPFGFFLQVLEEAEYLAQSQERGVSVVPYRLASSAPAGCHIVVGASQKDITLVFRQLGFLSQTKRNRLGLTESNPSKAFIQLYQQHSACPARFSASEKSLSGYAIAHNDLVAVKRKDISDLQAVGRDAITPAASPSPQAPSQDFITRERELFRSAGENQGQPFTPTAIQQEGFTYWKTALAGARRHDGDGAHRHRFPHWQEKIQEALRLEPSQKLSISQTHLNDFFACPRMWYFSRILRLKESDTQAELMADAWMGTIYHEIIRRYLEPLKACGTAILPPETDGFGLPCLPKEEENRLEGIVSQVLASQQKLSPLTQDLLLAQKEAMLTTANNFLVSLSSQFPEFQVVALEEELYHQSDHLPEFCLYGRLDCLLSSPADDVVLLDFKLGNPPKLAEAHLTAEEKLQNFQMAFYTMTYEAMHPGRTIDSAAFVTIRNGELTKIFGFGEGKIPQRDRGILTKSGETGFTFNQTIEACQKYVAEFAAAVTTCTFPQMAAVGYETCRSCPWKRVCRTTYTVGGAEA